MTAAVTGGLGSIVIDNNLSERNRHFFTIIFEMNIVQVL
jgi:hypothetical protein